MRLELVLAVCFVVDASSSSMPTHRKKKKTKGTIFRADDTPDRPPPAAKMVEETSVEKKVLSGTGSRAFRYDVQCFRRLRTNRHQSLRLGDSCDIGHMLVNAIS